MNRNIYRLIFNKALGMLIPVAETTRCSGKVRSGTVLLMTGLLATTAQAELPVPCAGGSCGGAVPDFVTAGQANYHVHGPDAVVNQVGDKAILNWESFNVSPGHSVQFQQVESLATQNLVQGANFTTLNRVWDNDPSVIAGILSQAVGQNANVILVNTNGIAFMGSSQINLNSFTASSLDIHDNFILNAFLTTEKTVPQFEGSGGFIKVFEGARITAGSQGRVMLIAPTVINKGMVEAPDGQVIAAAGTKVFLRSASAEPVDTNVRGLLVEVDSPAGLSDFETSNTNIKDGKLDGQAVALKDTALDKLGHVTNLGELSTPRGNITMVGYAVNQEGIARATTSVIANGSVYLLAKDAATAQDSSMRGGRATLGAGSLTEVLPDVSDQTGVLDGLTGTGLVLPSQVRVLGQDVRMERGAVINAPAGQVDFFALDNPSLLFQPGDPFRQAFDAPASNTARIHIDSGTLINVAGLENVKVSTARNAVEVELRGDELKDSPANRDGPLRSQKVYVDINRALANADSGTPTLIAKDSLQAYQARLERTVAERSTEGGAVRVNSQGEAIIAPGAVIDISGGSLSYTPSSVKTTLLMSRGVLTDIANARADVRYDGIATRYVQDFGRWNVKEVIDLGQTFNYDPGYTEGKNAGALEVMGLRAVVMQGDVQGRTIVGEVQRDKGIMPEGARLTLGSNPVANNINGLDYKHNQQIELSSEGPLLPGSFKFGDTLSSDLVNKLRLNPALLSRDKVSNLEIFSNQAAEVREALRVPQGGSVHITAQGVKVEADIAAPAGSIMLHANRNDLPGRSSGPLNLVVTEGVTLSARGAWVNELRGVPAGSDEVGLVNGGRIALSAIDDLALGKNTLLDVTGGGRLKVDSQGSVIAGNGGDISLSGNAVSGLADNVRGYGIGKGGTFSVASNRIQIGGTPDSTAGAVNLDPGFFERGGFGDINLAGNESVTLSEGVKIKPTLLSLELQPDYSLRPSGSRMEDFTRLVKLDDLVREPVSLSLTAENPDERGAADVAIGVGAHIEADPGAKITLAAARSMNIQGHITAPGGSITATLDHSHSFNFNASNSLWLGKQALLDVSGKALTYLDSQRLTQGEVLNGGSVTLNAQFGHVVAEPGSHINLAGAAPVRLDIQNQAGGLGQWVGSDAGRLSVIAREGVLLEGSITAQPGDAANRAGALDVVLGLLDVDDAQNKGFPLGERVLSLGPTGTPQTAGLAPGSIIPAGLNGKAMIGAAALEAAGFDRIALKSRDVIRLENDLNLGANRPLPLKEVVLDTPRIEMAGGEAALKAEVLRLGNFDANRVDVANTPLAGAGGFKAEAQLLELAGNLTLSGMSRAEFTGAQEIRFSGISSGGSPRPAGTLSSAADLAFSGAVIAPTTYSQVSILAPDRTVAFSSNATRPIQPLSALGSLTVTAANIIQGGNIWAPFGQLTFSATDTLTFKDGSLTSVAAGPGTLAPFGVLANGRSWLYKPDAFEIPQLALPEKSVRVQAANIDMRAGAVVDLAGGGDLQAYEFSVGPGGSRDILGDTGIYAILPGYTSGFAPGDRQENTGFDRGIGDAVYLSGVSGLPAGVYTLLPAHYALLPGAYAIRLDTGVHNLLPGQAYSKQDGTQVVPGYVTDSRARDWAGTPRDAVWSGFEVLSREQVLQRSEITLTRASDFFTTSNSRPQDAGLLSMDTTGNLKLDAVFKLAAGPGGRGAAVDISAPRIAITSDTSSGPGGVDPLATRISASALNALGASSLLIGGTRSRGDTTSDGTTLLVGAEEVTLANDVNHALKGDEVILAAKDALTLKSGSVIETQGGEAASGGGGYNTAGNGALVRSASTFAPFSRSGGPDRSQGTLIGEAGSVIRSGNSITLDATRQNTFAGTPVFADRQDNPIAGNLTIGAARVNFGNAPSGSEGLTLSQSELDGLNNLNSLTLTSYSTFDLYGDVSVGGVNAEGKPTQQALNLLGAGLAGLNNSGKTATLRATNILIANPAGAAFTMGGTSGNGSLAIQADTLILGEGAKSVEGFSQVAIRANEMVGRGSGGADVAAIETKLDVARIRGEQGASQTLAAAGKLDAFRKEADRALADGNTLGAKWMLSGTEVMFDTEADLPSGQLKLAATTGNLQLGANAVANAAGRLVAFFDVERASPGGVVELASEDGNVVVQPGAQVNVSAASGGDAGKVIVRAGKGTAAIAAGSLQGSAMADTGGNTGGRRGKGAGFDLDVAALADFSTLNTALNQGVFDGARTFRVRTGDVSLSASDTVRASEVQIAVDDGKLDLAGHIDVSGNDAGRINLYARNDVNVLAGTKLDAYSTGNGKNGDEVDIGTAEGRLNLAEGSVIDVHGHNSEHGGEGGEGGRILLRAPRLGSGAGNEVALDNINSSINGAKSVVIEAVKIYDGIDALTASDESGGSGGSGATLSLATVNADNTSFASHAGTIMSRLGKTDESSFHLRPGVEIRSTGDLTLAADWDLGASRAAGEPGMLTLRAGGDLKLNSNLSDGFNAATPFSSGTTPATLLDGDSWSYRLIGGADIGAAGPMAVKAEGGDVTLAAGKLVRTGTGDIGIAAGGDIKLADGKSVIYTSGRTADPADGFVTPANAQFSQDGGNVSLVALGNIVGTPSAQLYSNWLFRQGRLNDSTGAYTLQPAWWVRFDQFQQGVGALGGGNVTLTAGGSIENVSASALTQARMTAMSPDAAKLFKTGGGDVQVAAGADLLGGQYYADRGVLELKAGGKVDSGQNVNGSPLYTILAVGDAQARVQAREDVNIQTVLNPHLVVQSSGSSTAFNIRNVTSPTWSLFSTYGPRSGASLQSLYGNVALQNGGGAGANIQNAYRTSLNFNISSGSYKPALLSLLPPGLSITAFRSNIALSAVDDIVLSPAAGGQLTLLAANSISIPTVVSMSDRDPALIPGAVRPGRESSQFPNMAVSAADLDLVHAAVPVHTGDTQPARIYAVAGDVKGNPFELSLDLSKAFWLRAGQDVRDVGILAQHANPSDVSRVTAGRDIAFTAGNDRAGLAKVWVGGLGRLEVAAGRNIDLATSAGIVSRGDLDNAELPAGGVDIDVAAGVGAKGIDYPGTIDRLVADLEKTDGSPDDILLWQARWLVGNNDLDGADALQAVRDVRDLDADTQRILVREMAYSALRTTGRDFNNPNSAYAGNYERGYAALERVFPGLREKNEDGSFKNYQGEINLFASRIKTERGGNIEFMVPGGGVVVGLSNTPEVLVNTGNDVLGMLTVAKGNVRGFARDHILVNQSRILTVGGGDVLLWSSEGDIDAGKGKKTATAVPPPVIKVDAQGNVTQELQGAASGSGIGALSSEGVKAGDIDLIAPKGTVNAGDAGIRANNLNIAAQVVLGADNIAVAGTSTGTPVADASAVTATTSGATQQGDDVSKATAALSQNLSEAARTSDEMRKLKPTFISTEVIGHGE